MNTSDDFDIRKYWEENAAKQPDYRTDEERTALDAMFKQYEALRKLGWREACYCPKDGSEFLVIEAGSTGVFPCYYMGEWPKGSWWIRDAGDEWPSRPILFKPMPQEAKP